MKRQPHSHPSTGKLSVLRQVCNFIPPGLIPALAEDTGVARQCRSFSAHSHLTSLLYAQIAHCVSLNDLCDALHLHSHALAAVRGATPPSRNNLSNANKTRAAVLAEQLFWRTLDQLRTQHPGFGPRGRRAYGKAFRFKTPVHVADATVMELVANCTDWACHQHRKAAAKTHVRLDLQTLLPRYVIVDTAREHDNRRARELCAGLRRGEIAVLDKGYVDFAHFADLTARGIFWVTRPKDNQQFQVIQSMPGTLSKDPRILSDELVVLAIDKTREHYPKAFRRVVAQVEVDGELRPLTFITNNLQWAASSVADLYQARWSVEAFFKQLKQTLQVADFLGHSANAVRWQVWTALLAYLLLRFLAWWSQWGHSFARLVTLLRAALWQRWNLYDLLARCYGTAAGNYRLLGRPEQAYLLHPLWDSTTHHNQKNLKLLAAG